MPTLFDLTNGLTVNCIYDGLKNLVISQEVVVMTLNISAWVCLILLVVSRGINMAHGGDWLFKRFPFCLIFGHAIRFSDISIFLLPKGWYDG